MALSAAANKQQHQQQHTVATALASIVLPVPGGPYIRTPRHGRRIPALHLSLSLHGSGMADSGCEAHTRKVVGYHQRQYHRLVQQLFGFLQFCGGRSTCARHQRVEWHEYKQSCAPNKPAISVQRTLHEAERMSCRITASNCLSEAEYL
jgi:hypothetical protein